MAKTNGLRKGGKWIKMVSNTVRRQGKIRNACYKHSNSTVEGSNGLRKKIEQMMLAVRTDDSSRTNGRKKKYWTDVCLKKLRILQSIF